MMSEKMASKEIWIKHYSSGHNILLVGEGDFSFSFCLGLAFGSAANIVATSLDSYGIPFTESGELINKYKNAKLNLDILKALGASLLHGVDATQMKTHPDLLWKKFHRIIYNFPHAGFHGKEANPHIIMRHRNLVRGFLWSASSMLQLDGEIHISHKITAPFDGWRIEDLALECSLLRIGQDEFKIKDYPWYHNKRGSGCRPDEPFPLGACRTFKFKLCPGAEENLKMRRNLDSTPPTPQTIAPPPVGGQQQTPARPTAPQMFPAPHVSMQQQPAVTPSAFHDAKLSVNGQELHNCTSECHTILGGYLNHVEETFGSTSYDVRRSVEAALRLGFKMYVRAAPERPPSGFICILEELHHLSILRSERLRLMLLLHGQQH